MPASWRLIARSNLAVLVVLLLMLHPPVSADPGAETEVTPPYVEPGVLDVQAWDWLQQDLARMIDDTKKPVQQKVSPENFQTGYVGATVAFLELDAESAAEFQQAVAEALGEIGAARRVMQSNRAGSESSLAQPDSMVDSKARSERYAEAQRHAARLPLTVLETRPRHQLLREQMLKWLLSLDYGISAAGR